MPVSDLVAVSHTIHVGITAGLTVAIMAEYIGVTVEIKLNDDRTTLRGKITQVDNTVLVLDDGKSILIPAAL